MGISELFLLEEFYTLYNCHPRFWLAGFSPVYSRIERISV